MMEDMTKGERVLPMVLKANLKPARIISLIHTNSRAIG